MGSVVLDYLDAPADFGRWLTLGGMMKSIVLRLWVVAFACLPSITLSGEFECGILSNCSLDGILPTVKWKPSRSCYKPITPMPYFGSGVREYNDAVDSFNRWVSEVNTYRNCVRNEAAADMKKVPDIIIDGANQVNQEMSAEISRIRSNLEMSRPR